MYFSPTVIERVRESARLWLVVIVIAAVGCESADVGESSTKGATTGSVTVDIDFNGRTQNKSFRIPCSQDSTVFSILQRAENTGDVKFAFTGSNETAFVSSIDGVENEKGAGDNWTYRVNDELGDRSCGVFPVKPEDKILWRFGKYP